MRVRTAPFALALAVLALGAFALPAHGQTCANAPRTVPLFAGTTTVGSVTVSNDATHLYVTYTVTTGFIIDQSALQVATSLAGIPVTSSGDPKTSQFTYRTTNQPGVTSYTYTIPRPPVQSTIYIVANATVQQISASCGGNGDDDHEGDDEHHSSSDSARHSSDHSGGDGSGCVVKQTTCGGGSEGDGGDGEHSSRSGHSSSSSLSALHGASGDHHSDGDHHSGDDHHSDDDGHHSTQCCGPKQTAYAGDQPLGSGTYFTYFVNCGVPE